MSVDLSTYSLTVLAGILEIITGMLGLEELEWPEHAKSADISRLELYPIVAGVRIWADRFANSHLLILTGNTEGFVNTYKAKDQKATHFRALCCMQFNIVFRQNTSRQKKMYCRPRRFVSLLSLSVTKIFLIVR